MISSSSIMVGRAPWLPCGAALSDVAVYMYVIEIRMAYIIIEWGKLKLNRWISWHAYVVVGSCGVAEDLKIFQDLALSAGVVVVVVAAIGYEVRQRQWQLS